MLKKLILVAIFCPLISCAGQAQENASSTNAAVMLPGGSAVLGNDDTLEFTLRLPAQPDGSSIGVWLLASEQAEPEAGASSLARVLVVPSLRSNEWLAHVRGLKAPAGAQEPSDLLVRWHTPGDGPRATGELRLPGSVSFKSAAADVVLLTDGSLSMTQSDPRRLRVAAARDFIAAARRSSSIARIGIIQFDNDPRTLAELTPVSGDFEKALAALDERGATDIDGGIREALEMLRRASPNPGVANGAAGGAIVLLTDGKQEPGVYDNAHQIAHETGVAIHTLALGRDADRPLLRRIADETGGTFADAARDQELTGAYAAIASRITRTRTLLACPAGTETIHVPVDATCSALSIAAASAHAGTLQVERPTAQPWTSSVESSAQFFEERPAAGVWNVQWKTSLRATGSDRAPAPPVAASVSLTVSAKTPLYPLFFRSSPENGAGVELDSEAPVLALSLCNGAQPVAGAKVQATLDFGKSQTQSVELFDDGAHGDGLAHDGIYAASLPVSALYTDKASGEVTAIVTGQEFRRETRGSFIVRRNERPALAASPGALDFGSRIAGEPARAQISLRVRGPGGALKARSLPPLDKSTVDLSSNMHLDTLPKTLGPNAGLTVEVQAALPELLEPGVYGGVLQLELDRAQSIRIPWRVTVQAPALKVTPETLVLSALHSGARVSGRLQMASTGGTLTLYSAEFEEMGSGFRVQGSGIDQSVSTRNPEPETLNPIRSRLRLAQPFAPLTLHPEGAHIELAFEAGMAAYAGPVSGWLVFRDMARRERGRVQVSARVLIEYLEIDAPLAFGAVEAGDTVERVMNWRWVAKGRASSKQPVDAVLTVLDDPRCVPLQPALTRPAGAAASFIMSVPPDTQDGEAGGWVMIEAGPALALRRWSAAIVRPRLSVEPAALDFGKVLPGQSAAKKLLLQLSAVRSVPVEIRVEAPFAKPRLANMELAASALKCPSAVEMPAGGRIEVPLSLSIPEDAQEGVYAGSLRLNSRLGSLDVPLRLTVKSLIDSAAFHVAPSSVVLRFDGAVEPPAETVRITSHQDEPIQLALTLAAAGPPPAILLRDDKVQRTALELVLSARTASAVTVQAHPEARDGETCLLHLDGAGEHQVVEVHIERGPPPSALAPRDQTPALFQWLLLAFCLLLLVLITLARKIKKVGLRYGAYALLIHLAAFSWAMPGRVIMEALPASVEITLLESQDALGLSLNQEQARRLEGLRSGGDAVKKTPAQAEPGSAGVPPAMEALNEPARPAIERPANTAVTASRPIESPQPATPIEGIARAAANELPDSPLEVQSAAPPQTKPGSSKTLENETPRAASPGVERPAAFAPETSLPVVQRPELTTAAVLDAVPGPAWDAALSREEARADKKPQASARPTEPAAAADAPLTFELPEPLATAHGRSREAPPSESGRDAPVQEMGSGFRVQGSGFGAGIAAVAMAGLSRAEAVAAVQAGRSELPSGMSDGGVAGLSESYGTGSPGFGSELTRKPGGLDAGGDLPLPVGSSGSGNLVGGTPGVLAVTGGAGAGSLRVAHGGGSGRLTAASGSGLGGGGGTFASGGPGMAGLAGAGTGVGAGSGSPIAQGPSSCGLESAGAEGAGGTGSNIAASGTQRAGGSFGGRIPGVISGAGGIDDGPLAASSGGGIGTGSGNVNPQGTGKSGGAGNSNGNGTERSTAAGPDGMGGGGRLGLGGGPGRGVGGLLAEEGGTPALPGGGRGGKAQASALALNHGPLSKDLENADGSKNGAPGGLNEPLLLRGPATPYTGALLRVALGLARHSGDWNSSPTALQFLRTAFVERSGLPELEASVATVNLSDVQALKRCRMIMITSNLPIVFKPEEVAGMREYIRSGGTLWVNDSSATGYELFDQAFRSSVPNIIPGGKLEALALDHPFFSAGYDLSKGYKGFRVPPGDKYRQDYIEGVMSGEPASRGLRAGIIYTRNDYSDGMEIDPRMNAGMKSLTDLTNAEMLESSLRFGINLIAYSLGSGAPKLPPPSESLAEFEKIYRYNGPALPVLDAFTAQKDAAGNSTWNAEQEWCNQTSVAITDSLAEKTRLLEIQCAGGGKFKSAASRNGDLDLSAVRALVFDLHSGLKQGCNVSLLFAGKDGKAYESRAVFVRPGWNRNLRFPLDMGDMKSSADPTPWKDYDTPFEPRNSVERLSVLIYNLSDSGTVKVGPIRAQK